MILQVTVTIVVFLLEFDTFSRLFSCWIFCRHCSVLYMPCLCFYTYFYNHWLILLQHISLLVVDIIKAVTVFFETQTHLAYSAIDAAQSWANGGSVLFLIKVEPVVNVIITHIWYRLYFHWSTADFRCWRRTAFLVDPPGSFLFASEASNPAKMDPKIAPLLSHHLTRTGAQN